MASLFYSFSLKFGSCCFLSLISHIKICTICICYSAIHSLFPPPFFIQPLVMGIFILRCLSNQNMQHSEHVDLTVSIHKHFKTCKHNSQTGLNFLSCCETKQAELIVWMLCCMYPSLPDIHCMVEGVWLFPWGTCTVYVFFG